MFCGAVYEKQGLVNTNSITSFIAATEYPKQFKDGRIYFASWLEGTVHPDEDVTGG